MNNNIKVMLTVSVLINVFLIGLFSGHLLKEFRFEPKKGFCHKRISENLSADSKKLFESKMANLRASDSGFFLKLKNAREDMLTILTAETFDRDAYHQKLIILQGLHDERMRSFAAVIEELAVQMPQKDRIVLAQFLKKLGEHRSHGHRK